MRHLARVKNAVIVAGFCILLAGSVASMEKNEYRFVTAESKTENIASEMQEQVEEVEYELFRNIVVKEKIRSDGRKIKTIDPLFKIIPNIISLFFFTCMEFQTSAKINTINCKMDMEFALVVNGKNHLESLIIVPSGTF